MNIPFFSLQRKIQAHKTDYLNTIERLFETEQFIGGKEVVYFEEALRSFVNNCHVISCNSGTDALWMALKTVNLQQTELVITTPFSFIASSSEIVAHGAIPLFIDIDPETYNLSPSLVKKFLETECHKEKAKTIHRASQRVVSGILAVDLFGQLADYKALRLIAEEWNLWIIEDACQALGAHNEFQQAGTAGDIGTFSFYPTKNLGAYGDGGAVVTHNEIYAEKLKRLKNHGRSSHYHYEYLGINSRLDSLQAALLTKRLADFSSDISRRQNHAQQYHNGLQHRTELQLPITKIGTHSYHQYSIQLTKKTDPTDRTTLLQLLANKGIETRIFYPEPLDTISFLRTDPVQQRSCPITHTISNSIFSLPIWPELTKNEIDYIISAILDSLDQLYGHKIYKIEKAAQLL